MDTLPPMSDAPLMVGVSGLRGIVGKSLTPDVAARYAGAFGAWLRERADRERGDKWGPRPWVVLGSDGRAGYEAVRDAAAAGLREAGATVADIGIAMTPTVAVVADHEDADGAVIITASHNPQEWNGIKFLVRDEIGESFPCACAPSAGVAAQIIGRFRGDAAPNRAQKPGTDQPQSPRAAWHLDPVLKGIGGPDPIRARRFRVVLDSVNGAGRFLGREMLVRALGCELIHQGAEDSGLFPHPPEPLRENLATLSNAVRNLGAEIGFAQDPDADRLAIVDEHGRYIGEEYTLALAAEALLSARMTHPGYAHLADKVVVTNLSTSRMLDDIAAKYGARVVRTPVGEANVVEAMKREAAAGRDVVLGGEGNGGVIWPEVTYVRDSLSAMALVLSLMARTGKTLSRLVEGIPAYAIEKRKVDLARKEDAAPAVAAVSAAYKSHAIDLQDGVRVDFTHGPLAGKAWLHVRASNTEPIMRLIAEAPTAAEAQRVLDEAAGVINGPRS